MHYILVGWPWKQNDIFVSMSSTAKQKYLKLFQRTIVSDSDADENFNRFYFKWYGRRHLVIPIIFVVAITFAQSYFVGQTIATRLFGVKGFVIDSTAIAGFVGVYIWACWDFITRYSQRDLTSGDIYRGALRLLSGVAVGYAFAAIVKDTAGPFVAFAVGVFPAYFHFRPFKLL
jgi:hypothetical protein